MRLGAPGSPGYPALRQDVASFTACNCSGQSKGSSLQSTRCPIIFRRQNSRSDGLTGEISAVKSAAALRSQKGGGCYISRYTQEYR